MEKKIEQKTTTEQDEKIKLDQWSFLAFPEKFQRFSLSMLADSLDRSREVTSPNNLIIIRL